MSSGRSPPADGIEGEFHEAITRTHRDGLILMILMAVVLVGLFGFADARVASLGSRLILFVLLGAGLATVAGLGYFVLRAHSDTVQSALERIHDREQEAVAEAVERAETAEAYARDLEQWNRDLEQFAYVASHDLKEPLRMIRAYLQLLDQRYSAELDDDAREMIGYAVDGAGRMHHLITGLLDYSSASSADRVFETVDLDDALDDAIANLAARIQETGATIDHPSLPTVQGDPAQLTQLFQNLLANAVKFSGPAPPRIHITAEEHEDTCTIVVEDEGIGFDAEREGRIFDIFQKGHDGMHGGSGIGLAICQRIVARHEGRIWADSQPGEGARFCFTLPLRATQAPETEREGLWAPRTSRERFRELI